MLRCKFSRQFQDGRPDVMLYAYNLDRRGFSVRPDVTSYNMANQIWGPPIWLTVNPQAEVLKNNRAAYFLLSPSSMIPHPLLN